jgi:charged multivesicular body protein 4
MRQGCTASFAHCFFSRVAAQAALRQKKAYENELDRIAGTRMTLDTQVNAIESANMNLETMTAMRRGADALRNIHGSLYVSSRVERCYKALLTITLALYSNIDRVDQTMDSIREQMDLTNEISDAISNPVGMGHDLDEVRMNSGLSCLHTRFLTLTISLYYSQDELKNELEELEQAELNERLIGADHVPVHTPAMAGPSRVNGEQHRAQVVDDDDAELRALQAELAM